MNHQPCDSMEILFLPTMVVSKLDFATLSLRYCDYCLPSVQNRFITKEIVRRINQRRMESGHDIRMVTRIQQPNDNSYPKDSLIDF